MSSIEIWIVEKDESKCKEFLELVKGPFCSQMVSSDVFGRELDMGGVPDYVVMCREVFREYLSGRVQLKSGSSFVSLYLRDLTIEKDGKRCSLTWTEYRIIETLLRANQAACTRENLKCCLWKARAISNRALDVHICNLRKKIKGIDLGIRFNSKAHSYEVMNGSF